MSGTSEASNFILSPSTSSAAIQQRGKWSGILLMVGIMTTLGFAVPVGYNIGVINSIEEMIYEWLVETYIARSAAESFRDQYDAIPTDTGLSFLLSTVVSIFLVGGAVGSFGGAWVADRFGRKKSLLLCFGLFVIAAALFLTFRAALSIEMLILGRIVAGLAAGLTTSIVPMYLIELAPLSLSGTMGVLCSMGVTAGVVVGQVFSLEEVFGSQEHWHFALAFYAVLVIAAFLTYFWWPESPKYLYVIAGQKEQAKKELRKLRQNDADYIQYELAEMEREMHDKKEIRSIWSVLTDPALLLPVILVCALQGGQQLSGINAVFFYSGRIFKSAGVPKEHAQYANLGAGCVNLFVAFFSPFLMKTVNRRPLSMLSCFGSFVFLIVLTAVVHFIDLADWLPYACIASVFAYLIFYQMGLGPIPYFIGSEIFEVPTRPAGMALGSVASWSCNFFVALLFPVVQAWWGAWVFLPFAATCLLLTVLLKFYLPETRGKNPSDTAPLVANGFASRPTRKLE